MHTTRENKTTRLARYFSGMAQLGLSIQEADTLRLAEKTLHRWAELECGDSNNFASWSIERDEQTEKPYMVTHSHRPPFKTTRRRIADREAGALRRVRAVLANHPGLWFFQQGDPRGCALYVGKLSDVEGQRIECCYSSRGRACSV